MLSIFALAALAVTSQAALTVKGVDWSSLLISEAAGVTFKTAKNQTQPLESILKSNGVNTVRQRLWASPTSDYNLDYNIKLAKRAQAAGLDVYLNMHFSDKFADPGVQTTPAGWPTDIDSLTDYLYNYTLTVSDTFQKNGIPLSIVSIGNEVSNGFLWPAGATESYENIARLMHAASAGIKNSTLTTKPKIMIHVDSGWAGGMQEYFYKSVLGAGPLLETDFDIMGVSYYPFYNTQATLANLTTSLTNLRTTWGKEIMVAETGWPEACPNPQASFPSDVAAIPISEAGQTTFIQEVAKVVEKVEGADGVFYWEPAWIKNPRIGSWCADVLMFEPDGTARSSLNVFNTI